MVRLSIPAARAFLLACAWTLWLAAGAFASDPADRHQLTTGTDNQLAADLDGDGLHDQVTVPDDNPAHLHVWLSSTQSVKVLRSQHPIVRVVALDLDGDHRLELIANDVAASLLVWTNKGAGYRRYRAGPVAAVSLAPFHSSTLEQDARELSFDLPHAKRTTKDTTGVHRHVAAGLVLTPRVALAPAMRVLPIRPLRPSGQRAPPVSAV